MGGRGSIFMMMMPERARLNAQRQTMQDLANNLTRSLNRPVIDNTGLTATYDFVLTHAPESMGGPGGLGGPGPGGPGGGGFMIAVGPPGGGRGPGPAPDATFLPEGEAPQPL